METTTDLKGRVIEVGTLPAVGTKIIVNGNTFLINYVRDSDIIFRFSADLIKKYEPKE